ncbi:GspH/FimT family pseudopilin [Marinobacter sp.]|uniref:GspH/FimT family pseudopilin n=1 Tax=Marinobacter sp. TaxID=50741 RepID=UPI0039A62681
MSYFKASGLTLVELLVVLAISAILLGSAFPGIGHLMNQSQRHSATSELIALINLARHTAIHEQTSVTLCPLTTSQTCSSNWELPIVAFRDPTHTKSLAVPAQLIRQISPPAHGYLIVRSANRPYFRFRPSGRAREAIGNIVWCPDDHDPRYASQIRINMGGRPLRSDDSNGDGIVEGTGGTPVSCNPS